MKPSLAFTNCFLVTKDTPNYKVGLQSSKIPDRITQNVFLLIVSLKLKLLLPLVGEYQNLQIDTKQYFECSLPLNVALPLVGEYQNLRIDTKQYCVVCL